MQYLRPDSDINVGIWSTAPLYAKIDEVTYSDADEIISTANSTGSGEVGLSNATDPNLGTGHVVRFRAHKTAGSPPKTVNLVVSLIQGTTIIQSYTIANLAEVYTAYSFTLTEANANSITNYNDLRLRFEITDHGGGAKQAFVSWAELEIPDAVTGTEFQQAVAGALTPAGGTVKQGQVLKIGSFSAEGAISKSVTIDTAGTFQAQGVTTKDTVLTFGSSVSFAGIVQTAKVFLKDLVGLLGFSGSTGKTPKVTVSGSLTPQAQTTKQTATAKQGNLNFTGTVESIKTFLANLVGSISFEGITATSLAQNLAQAVGGVLGLSGEASKQTSTSFEGFIGFAGAVSKYIVKYVQGAANFTSQIETQVIVVYFQAVAGAILFQGQVDKRINKIMTGSITFARTFGKKVGKLIAGAINYIGTALGFVKVNSDIVNMYVVEKEDRTYIILKKDNVSLVVTEDRIYKVESEKRHG